MSEPISQLKRAFDEGFNAFNTCDEVKKMVSVNPYKDNTILAKEWQRGFDRGFWEQQKKLKEVC